MRWDRIPYYLKRLGAMRPSEPFVRLSHGLRHWRQERTFARDPETYSAERLWEGRQKWLAAGRDGSIRTMMNEALVERLPAGWWQDPAFWSTFAALYPQEAGTIIERADAVRSGRITLFGWKRLDLDHPIRWSSHLSGKEPAGEWPRGHYAAIRFFHDPTDPELDVKWCWELNRFQHLILLGAAWKLTRDEAYPRAAREQIKSWISAVQYPQGIQWSSNLEVALRLLSWIRCHVLCMDSDAWDEEFMRIFVPSLNLHCVHVENELTVHHAVSNHLLGEAAALTTAGILCTCFAAAGPWVRSGLHILERLTRRLILPDGVYAEQATGYLRFVAEFLVPLVHLANSSGIAVPPVISERIAAGIRFVDAISADLRRIPAIGDADSGHAVGWGLAEYWDFTALAAAGMVLCRAEIDSGRIGKFPAEAFLMLGPSGLSAFDALERGQSLPSPERACSAARHFMHGGYQVSSNSMFHLVFDTGPLGIPPRYGHGHADGLSFILSYKGSPVVVDIGTFLYNGPVKWRDYFRSTLAHNTIAIDHDSQSRSLETFLWARDLVIVADPPRSGDGWTLMHGFVEWPGATHHRYVLLTVKGYVIVMDRVEGTSTRTLEWSTHWHPYCRVRPVGGPRFGVETEAGDLDLLLLCPEAAAIEVFRGEDDPPAGWYSSHYGLKEPCCTLRAEVTTSLPALFLYAVKPKGLVIEAPEDACRLGAPQELVEWCRSSEFISWAAS